MTVSPADLLDELEGRGVRFEVTDGRLRASAPKDTLTPDLRGRLREHRQEIIELLRNRNDGRALPLTPAAREGALPLSFAQQRLWFLDQLTPGSTAFNLLSPLPLGGDVDVAALDAALNAMVARHEVLRTRLVADSDGVAQQVIDAPVRVALPVADVSEEMGRYDAAERLAFQVAETPFDLAAGPLLRGLLIRLGADEHLLALSMHHVIFDDWSTQILRRELTALYEAFRVGEPDPLPPLAVQYADFAVWQRQWLTGEVLDGQLAYWKERLAGLPVMELPLDRPRPPARSSDGAWLAFTVSPETAEGLQRIARAGGASMFMTLLAAFSVVLGRSCGTEDVVIGTPVAGRNRAEIEGLIGFFVNTLIMRTDLSGDPTFTELLGRVRGSALGAYSHQDLPFEQLVDGLGAERDRSRTPLFQVLFSHDATDAEGRGGGGQQNDDNPPPDGAVAAKFDLTVRFSGGAGGLAGEIKYSTDLFDAATMERMAGHLVTLLDAVAAGPERPLSMLSMVTAAERGVLVGEWNNTAVALPGVGGVHELVVGRA
ncbi:condensation domain-containing protein, partial [Streptomyces sp. NPDC048484]|uniref:condensation domain-containing protein n=1 Tax=Streptomyces sp. NPDC048484 TaxID=3155146 RepID=UPI00342CB95F